MTCYKNVLMHSKFEIMMLKFWWELEEVGVGTFWLILRVLINVALYYLELATCALILSIDCYK
jgi:hypothetical protein